VFWFSHGDLAQSALPQKIEDAIVAVSLRAIAEGLNERGIPTAQAI